MIDKTSWEFQVTAKVTSPVPISEHEALHEIIELEKVCLRRGEPSVSFKLVPQESALQKVTKIAKEQDGLKGEKDENVR